MKPVVPSTASSSKPNVLTGLSQNGKRQDVAPVSWAIIDRMPPANRKDPTRFETHVEQGKPVTLPLQAGESQGTLLVLRV
ncbi:hypothetical protein P3W85_28185 [Cupriavidus basilensis]|uniref:Uncharacterized protein n=1 Tax=Cupriavidus basilensis TaxID=68895 RepID=A0ABT6AW02_9BURK|nr:hypothetical protein [Cupriavidus basilensis]MDF3836806.1 hypothetical protein [Cupriavidus basilensis]